ncbi:group 1 truncated hemoglobin [Bacteriovorax sp. Seq25_V]|uniref:group I truncated hemoglobin n=1 Tax=Bacteriovorax sp. Seq25_V TaxID=1201288 RepID=UPI00038A1B84|nr:group 1 truncated hemoglobin [Bacteriovorax sp. Seq25_V]EQC44713.1 globin, protozoan/cyanobacterial family [Bacteriovorax sp. Seq25_V]
MSKFEEFEKLGGRGMLIKISKIFYDKIYEHPWIGLYFKDISQDVIESQQVDFMTGALGGDQIYLGKLPIPAHKHMFITNELFDLRQSLLSEALSEAGASEELKTKWLKIDEAFKSRLVKKDISECEKRFNTDEILAFDKVG